MSKIKSTLIALGSTVAIVVAFVAYGAVSSVGVTDADKQAAATTSVAASRAGAAHSAELARATRVVEARAAERQQVQQIVDTIRAK